MKWTKHGRFRKVICKRSVCSSYLKRRLPILNWLPNYKKQWLFEDILAGITVGLTAIPQSVAYGIVAGLSPEYGLYSAFVASFVYIVFGSYRYITIGPTAIMALMIQPLVLNYGPDIAVLVCFLKGCIITLLGVLHLGFLLDFISLPAITGFTSGAAVIIASAQFKSLLGVPGPSESFINSIISIVSNITQIRLWDTLLGFGTIVVLVLLKNIPGHRKGTLNQKVGWMIGLARNVIVVITGTCMAYVFSMYDMEPFILTGSINEGLPSFSLPPFSTTFDNRTYDFLEMTWAIGPTLVTMPIISTIEHVAISKAFARGEFLDTTQEMLALGICNIIGSFVRSMPVTGSFTRTAVNCASGVRTQFGGFFTGGLVLIALGLLTSTFRFIPRATLAAVITCAMYYLLDFETYTLFWRANKSDFVVMMITLLCCVFLGLEMGIVIGIVFNLIFLLYFSARPSIKKRIEQIEGQRVIHVIPEEAVTFLAAENLRISIIKLSDENPCRVILNGRNMKRIDVTVAKNIKLLANDLSLRNQEMTFVNCSENVENVLTVVAPELSNKFRKDRGSM